MDKPQIITRAKIFRCKGWSYARIGKELGKSGMTVYRWLNPKYVKTVKKQRDKEYRARNLERRRDYNREWVSLNRDRHNERQRRYAKTDRGRKWRREYVKNRRKSNVSFSLAYRLRIRMWDLLKGSTKTGSAVRDLGCSLEELKEHLERQFQPGMSWGNYGLHGWHIDHIKPLASFDLTDREQFLKACHYTNLQPLWAEDNWSKSSRVDQELNTAYY